MVVDGRALGSHGIRASDFITILHFLYIVPTLRNAMPFFLHQTAADGEMMANLMRRLNQNEAFLENDLESYKYLQTCQDHSRKLHSGDL